MQVTTQQVSTRLEVPAGEFLADVKTRRNEVRFAFDIAEIDGPGIHELAEAIAAEGISSALLLDSSGYMLDGYRRAAALGRLVAMPDKFGMTLGQVRAIVVPVDVVPTEAPEERLLRAIGCQSGREWSEVDQLATIRAGIKAHKLPPDRLRRAMQVRSEPYFRQLVAIAMEAPAWLWQAIGDGGVKIVDLRGLFSRPEAERRAILTAASSVLDLPAKITEFDLAARQAAAPPPQLPGFAPPAPATKAAVRPTQEPRAPQAPQTVGAAIKAAGAARKGLANPPLERPEYRKALAAWASTPLVAVFLGLLDGWLPVYEGANALGFAAGKMASDDEGRQAEGWAEIMRLYMSLPPERQAGRIETRERSKAAEGEVRKAEPLAVPDLTERKPAKVAPSPSKPSGKSLAKPAAKKAAAAGAKKDAPAKPKPTKTAKPANPKPGSGKPLPKPAAKAAAK